MTWVGWFAMVVLFLAFLGNFMQYRGYKQLETPKVRRVMMISLFIGFALNLLLLVGILFVGTPPLF